LTSSEGATNVGRDYQNATFRFKSG
jgi:hypothetical protein